MKFNSKEYVVNINVLIGWDDTATKVFSTYEKAKAFFDECVADEKANNPLMKLDDKVVCDYDNHFSIYYDGYWGEDEDCVEYHYEITIEERMVY